MGVDWMKRNTVTYYNVESNDGAKRLGIVLGSAARGWVTTRLVNAVVSKVGM